VQSFGRIAIGAAVAQPLLKAPRMKTTRRLLLAFTAVAAAGCFPAQVSQPVQPAPDMATSEHKPPPANGSGTTSDCTGVTEKGRCEMVSGDEMAETCDLVAGQLKKIDCTAMGKHCLLDAHKGATCATLPSSTSPGDGGVAGGPHDMAGGGSGKPPTPPGTPPKPPTPPAPAPDLGTAPHDMGTATHPPDMSMPDLCNHGVSFYGYCSGATAIWCDPSTGQIITWDCAMDGYSCGEWDCADGAYCCGQTQTPMADMAMTTSPSPECTALGYDGACQGDTATWCDNGTIYAIDCAARGQGCAVNSCATGAFCCDTTATPPPAPDMSQPADECTTLGLAGVCSGNDARYCAGGVINDDDCTAKGQTCQVDTCGYGANCCP
jgi:hypothetical protein